MPLRPDYPIRTARLLLRPYAPADLDAALDLESRPEVVRYLMWAPMDLAATQAFIERRVKQTAIEEDDSALILAASVPPSDRVIGEFMLRLRSAAHRQGEIGWTVHPDVQGLGYATEGATEMLRLGFEELRLHRITAEADPRNGASVRLMERLGMRHEADLHETLFVKDEWVDEVVYAILEDEWRTSRS